MLGLAKDLYLNRGFSITHPLYMASIQRSADSLDMSRKDSVTSDFILKITFSSTASLKSFGDFVSIDSIKSSISTGSRTLYLIYVASSGTYI